MKKNIIFLFAIATVVMMSSCDFNPLTENNTDAETLAEAEISYLKSSESVDEEVCEVRSGSHLYGLGGIPGGGSGNGNRKPYIVPHNFFGPNFPGCAEVTVSSEEFPKEITIVYGEDCITRRGIVKTGTIIITMSDTITNPGAIYTVTFEDMTIGKRTIDRTATIINEGQNDDGNWVLTIDMLTTIVRNDTITIVRDYELTQEWLEGFDTPQSKDDIFLKSGSGTITVNDNIVFQRTIIDPLLIDRSCQFILSGVIEILKGNETMTIDFGDGECDNIAVVTKDGESEEIELISGRFRKEFNRRHRNMTKQKGWW